jgi:hypothetical protein
MYFKLVNADTNVVWSLFNVEVPTKVAGAMTAAHNLRCV